MQTRAEAKVFKGFGRGRIWAAALILVVAVFALWQRLADLDGAALRSTFNAIGPMQWLGAASATILSFWAIARYDRVAHWALATGVRPARAGSAGIMAIALSQMIGLNALTAGLIRWRLLPEIGGKGAARVTALVGLTFLISLAVLGAGVLALGGDALSVAGFVTAVVLMVPLFVWPPKLLARLNLPLGGMAWRIMALTAVDVGCAGLALYMLMPPGSIAPLMFLTVFALALASGLIGGTPAGVGPFELTMVAFFPALEVELVAALLAFRLIYYVVPAALAAVVFGLAEWRRPARRTALAANPAPAAMSLRHGEARLADAGAHHLVGNGAEVLLAARAGGALAALGPMMAGGSPRRARRMLEQQAKRTGLTPVLYKCDARLAAAARQAGWTVLRLAEEAVVLPARFDLGQPACRQLRRKLRQAEGIGLTIERTEPGWHLAELSAVAAEWARAHGGERGFSMGHAGLLAQDLGPIFIARQGGRIVAFVSFLATKAEWTLDLMRHRDDVPPGTMQALVARAIAEAAASGIPRLSLAAVPAPDVDHLPPLLAAAHARYVQTGGLRQFKAAFAPVWEPRYIAAPGRVALLTGGLAILRQITAGPSRLSHGQPGPEMASAPAKPEWTPTT